MFRIHIMVLSHKFRLAGKEGGVRPPASRLEKVVKMHPLFSIQLLVLSSFFASPISFLQIFAKMQEVPQNSCLEDSPRLFQLTPNPKGSK